MSPSDWELKKEKAREEESGLRYIWSSIVRVAHLMKKNCLRTIDGFIAWMNVYVIEDLYGMLPKFSAHNA